MVQFGHQINVISPLIGTSPAMSGLRALIARVAASDASVLVMGPSGAGKELVAHAIHAASSRHTAPFVALNCGAVPPDLMESELFGHERGAFTGAAVRRVGRFEEAHGGTLFLDEIGDMPFHMQVKLLRVLEDGLVQRLGGGAAIAADVRIVSATHQNMAEALADGRFREDLYFRLGVVPIHVPALAERAEDVPLLIEHFHAQRKGRRASDAMGPARFDATALARLKAYPWPGNVRELRNVVARADILFGGRTIGAAEVDMILHIGVGRPLRAIELPDDQPQHMPVQMPASYPVSSPLRTDPIDLRHVIETLEQDRIQMALVAADGVISEAARLLTLKRTTLIEKMRKYGVGKQAA